jgi:soluble lytic murein transglycosylase
VLSHPFIHYTQLLKDLESHQDIAPFLYKVYYTLKGNGEKRAFLDFCYREYPEYVCDMARLMGVVHDYKEAYPILLETKKAKDPAIINAIILKESGFNPYAVSGAGALGLMQLMPQTAKIIAKDLGLDIDVADLTKNPEMNVKLGTAYFEQKLERFKGHKEITLSGYNAGPLYSDKWLKRYGDPRAEEIDLLTWIELIPYSETRSYVQRVMANYGVYQRLLAD